MALILATMKTTIKDEMDAEYGAPADAAEQDKFVTSLAKALITILTAQAVVSIVIPADGIDNNGDKILNPTGSGGLS